MKKILLYGLFGLYFCSSPVMAGMLDSTGDNISKVNRVISSTSTDLDSSGNFDDMKLSPSVKKVLTELWDEKMAAAINSLNSRIDGLQAATDALRSKMIESEAKLTTSIAAAKNEAITHAENKGNWARNDARNYAEQRAQWARNDARAHADNKANWARNDARAFAENKGNWARNDARAFAENKGNWARNDARAYTDQRLNSFRVSWNNMPSGSICGKHVVVGGRATVNIPCLGYNVQHGCPPGFRHHDFGYFEAGGGPRTSRWCSKI